MAIMIAFLNSGLVSALLFRKGAWKMSGVTSLSLAASSRSSHPMPVSIDDVLYWLGGQLP